MSPSRRAHSSEQRSAQEWTPQSQPEPGPTLFDLTTPADPASTLDASVVINVVLIARMSRICHPTTSAQHPPTTFTKSSANNICFPVVLRSIHVYRYRQDQG
jgi:hypothetical protein